MTENTSTRFAVGVGLLAASLLFTPVAVYRVLEDHGFARPATFVFFAIAFAVAIAPLFFGLRWLRGWRAWFLGLLSVPMLLLVAMTVWSVYQKAP